VLNLLVGLGTLVMPGIGMDQAIAWQAHIGGFLAGLILFPLFDPVAVPHPESEIGESGGSGGEEPPPEPPSP
jgi:membrane associated rhomboid family serine protease